MSFKSASISSGYKKETGAPHFFALTCCMQNVNTWNGLIKNYKPHNSIGNDPMFASINMLHRSISKNF